MRQTVWWSFIDLVVHLHTLFDTNCRAPRLHLGAFFHALNLTGIFGQGPPETIIATHGPSSGFRHNASHSFSYGTDKRRQSIGPVKCAHYRLGLRSNRDRPMPATQTVSTCTCPKCGGSGKLQHYSHIANGDCFACGGTGKITIKDFIGDNSDVILEVNVHQGRFLGAILRCRTWKLTKDSNGKVWHTWTKDAWYKDITDVDEAREMWRNAKRYGIKTELWD